MKIKEGLILRKVGKEHVVMSTNSNTVNLNGMLILNDSGAFLFNCLKEEKTYEQLLQDFLNEYDIDKNTASKDLDEFLNKLREKNLLL